MEDDQEPLKPLLKAIERLEYATTHLCNAKALRNAIQTSLPELDYVKLMLKNEVRRSP